MPPDFCINYQDELRWMRHREIKSNELIHISMCVYLFSNGSLSGIVCAVIICKAEYMHTKLIYILANGGCCKYGFCHSFSTSYILFSRFVASKIFSLCVTSSINRFNLYIHYLLRHFKSISNFIRRFHL